MIDFPYKVAFAAGSVILSMCGVFMFGRHQYNAGVTVTAEHYEAAIARQKVEALTIIAAETDKVRKAEQALNDFRNKQEQTDAIHTKTIDDLHARMRALAGSSNRLRDPNAAGCGQSSGSSAGQTTPTVSFGTTDVSQASGLLSEQLTGLLQQLTYEADFINAAYASCRAWVNKVTGE